MTDKGPQHFIVGIVFGVMIGLAIAFGYVPGCVS